MLAPLQGFEAAVTDFFSTGGVGCNVTVPFKLEAFELCDVLSDAARVAGAVNTLWMSNGLLHGDNTDGIGLVNDLVQHGVSIDGAKILIIGAGGATRGALLPLLNASPKSIFIVNRTAAKATELAQSLNHPSLQGGGYNEVPDLTFDIIINASSAGLSGQAPPISTHVVGQQTTCYDMVYGASSTPFCQWAQQQGAYQTIDGLGMLVNQAAESFFIWLNATPNVQMTLAALRKDIRG